MIERADRIDAVQRDLDRVRPGLDTSGVAVTGRLQRLARHVTARREEHLRAFGLTVADYDVLATLRRGDEKGLNPRDVQRAVMITSGGMTKRLDRLEKAGLVERCPDPTDRRGVLIRITRRAVPRSTAHWTLLDAEREAVVGALPDIADRDRLVGLLRELLLAFERFDEVSSDEA